MRLRLKTLVVLKISLILSSCAHSPPNDVKVWAGNSVSQGVERKQAGEALRCEDPKFDNYLCMSREDFMELMKKKSDSECR